MVVLLGVLGVGGFLVYNQRSGRALVADATGGGKEVIAATGPQEKRSPPRRPKPAIATLPAQPVATVPPLKPAPAATKTPTDHPAPAPAAATAAMAKPSADDIQSPSPAAAKPEPGRTPVPTAAALRWPKRDGRRRREGRRWRRWSVRPTTRGKTRRPATCCSTEPVNWPSRPAMCPRLWQSNGTCSASSPSTPFRSGSRRSASSAGGWQRLPRPGAGRPGGGG